METCPFFFLSFFFSKQIKKVLQELKHWKKNELSQNNNNNNTNNLLYKKNKQPRRKWAIKLSGPITKGPQKVVQTLKQKIRIDLTLFKLLQSNNNHRTETVEEKALKNYKDFFFWDEKIIRIWNKKITPDFGTRTQAT
jgi:hypothetical protein